jgi:hypothetical protein
MSRFDFVPASDGGDASGIVKSRPGGGRQRVGPLVPRTFPDLLVSKRRMRKVESIECVRMKRETARQNLGFSSRPFVLCGLPVRRPAAGSLLHERRNGHFILQVTGHPSYGWPWGQDRLVPIFLATQAIRQKSSQITFESAAAMLDTFGMQQGGSPTSGRLVSENLRSNDLLRDGLPKRACDGRPSSPFQLHDGSADLVFTRSRSATSARRLPEHDRPQ